MGGKVGVKQQNKEAAAGNKEGGTRPPQKTKKVTVKGL